MPVAPGTYRYYLAPWVWHDDVEGQWWEAPTGTVGLVDLRPVPAQALTSVAEGFGFFAVDAGADAPPGSLYLGNDLGSVLDNAQRRDAEKRLELSPGDFSLASLLDNVWLTITDLADVTGGNRCKPLMPTVEGNLELHLGRHSPIKVERFNKARHGWVQVAVQRDFGDRAGSDPRLMAALRNKYGFTPQEIIGIRGGATISDNFNRSDESLDAGSWTEVLGDWSVASNEVAIDAEGVARYTTALSSADHYSQVNYVSTTSTAARAGVTARLAAAANTNYHARTRPNASTSHVIGKYVTGTKSNLQITAETTPALPGAVRLDVNGSTLKHLFKGVQKGDDLTDTSITSNTYAGMYSDSSNPTLDDFIAEDLAASGLSIPVAMRHYMQMAGAG